MAEVDTIEIPDASAVAREVATLSLALRTEDAAAASDPRGIPLMLVRRDTLSAAEVSADGDYVAAKGDNRGALHVAIAATALSIAKAEDAAHSSGDVGVPAMSVRQDAAAALSGTDADYQPLITDASGRLWVNIGAAASSIAKAEDAAHTTADVGVFAMGVRRDTAASGAGTDGDYASLNLDSTGHLWARIGLNDTLYTEDAAAAANPVGPAMIAVRRDTLSTSEVSADGDNVALKADSRGALHVAIAATALSIAKAEDAAHASGDVGVPAMFVRSDAAAALAGTDGDYQPGITDASGRLWVNIAGNLYTEDAAAASDPVGMALIAVRRDTLSASEVSADGDNVAVKADSSGRLHVHALAVGSAAHDAAIAGNPVRLGARALSANYTAVATGDTADLVSTLVGALVTKPYALPELDWSYAAAASGIANTTTAVTFKTAAGAGLKNYITRIDFMSESLTNATELAIRDGAGGTVLWRTKIPATTVIQPTSFVLPNPIVGSANTLLEVVTLTASGAGAVYFNAGGFVAP